METDAEGPACSGDGAGSIVVEGTRAVAYRDEPLAGGFTEETAGGACATGGATGCETVREVAGCAMDDEGRLELEPPSICEPEALVSGVDIGLLTEAAVLDGPSLDATTAGLSTNRRYSYLDLMNFSSSLSRSNSDMLAGGGFRASFGL